MKKKSSDTNIEHTTLSLQGSSGNELPTVVFTGGGSGGHVFPALGVLDALGEDFRKRHHIIWLGSKGGIEEQIVSQRNIEFKGLAAGKLRRYISFKNLVDALKFAGGIVQAILYFLKLRPVLVFSKGGFVSVAPVIAAGLMGVPVISHESDVDPGLATRINRRFTRIQCIPFPESRRYYPEQMRVEVTGNPVRKDILAGDPREGRRLAGFDSDMPVLLVQGGSLGARQLNSFIEEHAPRLLEKMCIIHQTGDRDWTVHIPELLSGRYFTRPFFAAEYPHILAAADLVLSRSGAGSLWELGITRKPAFFIPLTQGARGDQMRNAQYAESRGAAKVFHHSDKDCMAIDELAAELVDASQDKTLRSSMAAAWDKVVHTRGADNIAQMVREILSEEQL